jgi:hypothetical protein
MKNFGYMIERILSMNVLGFFKVAHKIHKKTKKNYLFIIIDMVWCGLRHMAGYNDYLLLKCII